MGMILLLIVIVIIYNYSKDKNIVNELGNIQPRNRKVIDYTPVLKKHINKDCEIYFHDGTTLTGKILSSEDSTSEIKVSSGKIHIISNLNIEKLIIL